MTVGTFQLSLGIDSVLLLAGFQQLDLLLEVRNSSVESGNLPVDSRNLFTDIRDLFFEHRNLPIDVGNGRIQTAYLTIENTNLAIKANNLAVKIVNLVVEIANMAVDFFQVQGPIGKPLSINIGLQRVLQSPVNVIKIKIAHGSTSHTKKIIPVKAGGKKGSRGYKNGLWHKHQRPSCGSTNCRRLDASIVTQEVTRMENFIVISKQEFRDRSAAAYASMVADMINAGVDESTLPGFSSLMAHFTARQQAELFDGVSQHENAQAY